MMDEEKLISLVMGYPELYDLENKHYMNTTRKNNIWAEISALLGVDDATCKEKWKALRDAYSRCIKRRKSKSGDGAKKLKKWRFESQMEFLTPYFQERTSKTNIQNSAISDDEDDQPVSSPETLASTSSAPVNSPRPFSRATSTPDHDTAASTSSAKNTKSTVFKTLTARKKNQRQHQSPVADVLEKYLENRTVSRSQESTTSTIHSFFKAMADTVAALSPTSQLSVKNKVYSIVSQAELENLNQTSMSPFPTRCEPIPNIVSQSQPINYMQSGYQPQGNSIIPGPSGSIVQVPANTEQIQPSESILYSVISQVESENSSPFSTRSEPMPNMPNIAQVSVNTDQFQTPQSILSAPAKPQYKLYIDPDGNLTRL